MEVLCFRLPGHGDATLRNMNSLRSRQHFCDVTIIASDRQTFRGHKVVLAACSPFLRDQFLLNPSPELKVSMLHSSSVVCELLQSCYTGILQFSPKEIVNYLTAASYLQMEHVVEKCRGALSQYLQPRTPSPPGVIKLEESDSVAGYDSDSQHPPRSRSPPAGKLGSLQPRGAQARSDRVLDAQTDTRTGSQEVSEIKLNTVNLSGEFRDVEEEEGREQDYEVFQVCIEDEDEGMEDQRRERGRDVEEEEEGEGGGAEGGGGGEVVVSLDGHQSDGGGDFGGGDVLGAVGKQGHRMWRRRPWEMGRGRGRGYQGRRRVDRDRRLLSAPPREEWIIPTPEEWNQMGPYGLATGWTRPREAGPWAETLGWKTQAGKGRDQRGRNPSRWQWLGRRRAGEWVGSGWGGGPVSCEHCGLAFPSPDALTVHARSAHLLFVCPQCGKHFSHAHHLSRHMSVHRGARSHRCPLCQKTFTQKSTLCDHMNLHSGERPHRCSYCHVRFAHKPALRRHLKEQHAKTTAQNCLEAQREREREGGAV
ncbi:hypothetical protein AGOR_G00044340 [Albula goreensis]|uniref:Zinc finger and BTB domain containing 12 n=1 Tax=Albula goreensis TaxID=1534307 RepID=A0A8T3E455_9TELE|nr:hypothetical protein AGOR_G00044340 [Albula goreensis]